MKIESRAPGLVALGLLVALTGMFLSALPGHMPTEGFVVRADNCVQSGQASYVNGVPTCDCTIIGGHDCGCITAGKCPPGVEEEMHDN
jgi:hypothetical protein